MKKRVSRWWLFCVIPLVVFGFSMVMHSCGGNDNICSDQQALPSQQDCTDYAKMFGCSSSSYDDSNGLCVIDGCTICSCLDIHTTADAAACSAYGTYFGCLPTFTAENGNCNLGGMCEHGPVPGTRCLATPNCRDSTICRLTCSTGQDCTQNPDNCPDGPDDCVKRCALGANATKECTRAADCDVDGPGVCVPGDPPNPAGLCAVCGFKSDVF